MASACTVQRRHLPAILQFGSWSPWAIPLHGPAWRPNWSTLSAPVSRRSSTRRAWIGGHVSIGDGSMVFGLTSVTAHTTLGRHVLVNPGTTIAHDCLLGDYATLGPSCALAGGVVVEDGAELGVGVRVAPGVRIGRGAMVGAGAVCIAPGTAGHHRGRGPGPPNRSP